MTASPRHDFAALAAYLQSNREFVAPAIEAAVRSLAHTKNASGGSRPDTRFPVPDGQATAARP